MLIFSFDLACKISKTRNWNGCQNQALSVTSICTTYSIIVSIIVDDRSRLNWKGLWYGNMMFS